MFIPHNWFKLSATNVEATLHGCLLRVGIIDNEVFAVDDNGEVGNHLLMN